MGDLLRDSLSLASERGERGLEDGCVHAFCAGHEESDLPNVYGKQVLLVWLPPSRPPWLGALAGTLLLAQFEAHKARSDERLYICGRGPGGDAGELRLFAHWFS